jgi:hypothetical protein
MGLKRAKLWVVLAVLAALILSAVTVLAAEIVENGTLDTDVTGWYGDGVSWYADDHTGNSGGGMDVVPEQACALQDIGDHTSGDAGTLDLTFWVRVKDGGAGPANVLFGIADLLGEFSALDSAEASSTWAQHSLSDIAIPAGDHSGFAVILCNVGETALDPKVVFDDVTLDWQAAPAPTPTPIPPTFNELTNHSITVYGLIAVALVFSEQIAKIIYVWMWRANK